MATPVFGGEPQDVQAQAATSNENKLSAPAELPHFSASVDYNYVGDGDTDFRGHTLEKSDAHTIAPKVFGEVPLNDQWYLPMGVSTEHAFLDTADGAPIPDRINVMRVNVGVGYRFNEKWDVSAGAGPLFYNLEDVEGRNIGFGGMIRAVYYYSDKWTFAAGVAVAPDAEIPVFPAAGVIWKPTSDLTVSLMAPNPRVIRSFSDKFRVFVGADVRFAVFRTDDSIQSKTGVSGYNNALGTYRDYHLGAGGEYDIIKGLSLSAETGFSVGREIDYTRIDKQVDFHTSPYARVGIRYSF